jgi:uncharacterized protein YndB with AHSA1/START domain
MKKLHFKILINAPREKVWKTTLDDATYREWTSAFMPGSYAVTDWQKGSKTLFLGPDGSGMVSRIAENIPNEYLSIEHLGEVKDGVEDTTSEKVQQWSGAFENYTLKTVGDNQTEFSVECDMGDDYVDMFKEIWPKALAKLKEVAER